MPLPILDRLTPEFRELVDTTREYLFRMAKEQLSREEAIYVKQQITEGLGVFNSRHNLRSDSKTVLRRAKEAQRMANANPHSNNALTTER